MSIDSSTTMDVIIKLGNASRDRALKAELSKLQDSINGILEENRVLRTENHELKNEKIISIEIERRDNAYYHNGKGPYCTTCYDNNKKLILYTLTSNYGPYPNEYVKGDCGVCKAHLIDLHKNPEYKD